MNCPGPLVVVTVRAAPDALPGSHAHIRLPTMCLSKVMPRCTGEPTLHAVQAGEQQQQVDMPMGNET